MFNRSEYPGFHQAFYGKGNDDDDLDGDGDKSEPPINLNHTLPRRSRKKEKPSEDAVRKRRKSRIKLGLLHRKAKKDVNELSAESMQEQLESADGRSNSQMYRPDKEKKLDPSEFHKDDTLLLSDDQEDEHSDEYSDSDNANYDLEYEEYYRETNDDITQPKPVKTGFSRDRSGRLQENLDEHQQELDKKLFASSTKGRKGKKKARTKERKEKKDRKRNAKKDRAAKGKKVGKKVLGKMKHHPKIEKLESLRKNFKPSLNLLNHKDDDTTDTEQGHELVL